jgi:hypothetical protein
MKTVEQPVFLHAAKVKNYLTAGMKLPELALIFLSAGA